MGTRPHGDDGRRHVRPWNVWRVGTPITLLACGCLLVISALTSEGTDLRPAPTDLASLTSRERLEYQHLQARVADLQRQVNALVSAVPEASVVQAQRHAQELRLPAGLTPVSGTGVRITLSDAPSELIDKTSLDPNRLVVHQQDIQAVVNALWMGGAKAVTVAGQRIITTTGIKCSGSTVQLQGVPYPEPFVIEGIGNVASLLSAINSSPYLGYYRADAANPAIEVGWQLRVMPHIEAPAFDGPIDISYAKVARGS